MKVTRIVFVSMFLVIVLGHARAVVRQASTGTCSFEDGLCGWNATYNGWKIGKFIDGSLRTGPNRDHTYENENGSYIYLDSASIRKNQPQTLQSPLVRSNDNCLSFWYHMRGQDIGNLTVSIETINTTLSTMLSNRTILWSQDGELEDRWYQAEMTIQADSDFIVLLEGTTKGEKGDIALDDIHFSNISCRDTCSFDNGLCSWVLVKSDGFDWKHGNRNTSWQNEGPQNGHTTGNAYDSYMHIDASLLKPGGKAALRHTGLYRPGQACLSFWYHMHGKGMGTLNVTVRRKGESPLTIWSRSGDQGNNWTIAAVDMEIGPEDIIELEAIRGNSTRSDFALDDISLRTESCFDCTFDDSVCVWNKNEKWKLSSDTAKEGTFVSSTFCCDSIAPSLSCSVSLHGIPGPVCVNFIYFLVGSNLTRLRLYMPNQSDDIPIWNAPGRVNKGWSHVFVTVIEPFSTFTLLFEVNIDCSHSCEVGIDDISVKLGKCQELSTSSPEEHSKDSNVSIVDEATARNTTIFTVTATELHEIRSVYEASSSIALTVGVIAGTMVFVVIIVLICRKCQQHIQDTKDIELQSISGTSSTREKKKETCFYAVHCINPGYRCSSNNPLTDITMVANERYHECTEVSNASKSSYERNDTYDTTCDDIRPRFDISYDHVLSNAKAEYDQTHVMLHARSDTNETYDHVTTGSDDVYDKPYVMTQTDTNKSYDQNTSGAYTTHFFTRHNSYSHDDNYEDITF